MKYLVLLTAVLSASLLTSVAYYQPPNQDEQTILSYMQQIPEHAGKADAASLAFWKKITADHTTNVEPNGQLEDYGAQESATMMEKMIKDNPELKSSVTFRDIKVRVYGDTAIVTYLQDLTVSGMKDVRLNWKVKSQCLDTWQKQSGEWKTVATTNTPMEPLSPDKYKTASHGVGGPN
jgi:ketosteroid isomerase-like protein